MTTCMLVLVSQYSYHSLWMLCIGWLIGLLAPLSELVQMSISLIFILLFYFLTLQYCIGFAIHQNESATGIHVFAILNPPPSSLPIPSPWVVPVHQRQASSTVHWTWTSNSFHMILYMFQCHSPKSSHPLPFPQSPKDCSIHQCLFCCLVYRVIVIIFLNSIYMC